MRVLMESVTAGAHYAVFKISLKVLLNYLTVAKQDKDHLNLIHC